MPARPAVALALAAGLALAAPTARAAAELPPPAGRDPVAERVAALSAALERDRGARGLALLEELDALSDDVADLARLAPVYAAAAGDPRAHPEVRAEARLLLARLERSRGNLRRSEAHLRGLGLVTSWWVAGPFDDEGRRGLDVVLPPERSQDLAARWPGKVREVGWRALPAEAVAGSFVHLGAALRPAREVVAFALAVVDAPRDERVQLWLGASGASRVWVNGAPALLDRSYHPARLDQRGAAVTLRKGANRILVKLCHQEGRMGFYLRLATPSGEGRTLAPGDPAAPAAEPGPSPAPVAGALGQLEARARAAHGGAEARARADLALALSLREAGEAQERRAAAEARRASELAPRDPELALLAARLEEEHGPRRAAVERALAAAPGHPRALAALAQEELDQGRPHVAARLLERAIRAAPGWAAPRVALAEALDRAGLDARAARLAAATADAFPTVPAAVRAAARAARGLGRLDEAAARQRTLLALRFDDAPARSALAALLAERGDVAGAAALHAEALRLDPSEVAVRLQLADLLAANGRTDEAEAAYAAALRLCPEDADGLERRGRARLADGRAKDAQGDLQRALELAPQRPELKELVRSLEPARERFERPYALDAGALAAAAPAPAADDDAIVLGDLKVTRVLRSGLASSFNQTVVKVFTARGADAFRRHVVSWAPERQEVRIERARVLKPDGTVVETHEESERSASEPWYRLYYDTLAKTLSFAALAPGDVLEVAWRVDDVAGENLLSDYFGDLAYVDETTRKARFDYVLLVPADRPIHANAPAGVEHARRDLGGGVAEYRWRARDVPRIAPEPGMPGWSEVSRYLHVSTYASWEQVGRFYWGLVREQLRPGEELRALAEGIAAGVLRARAPEAPRLAIRQAAGVPARPVAAAVAAADRETRVAVVGALYDFVVSQTRYVGLEFGIHGFKPYRVDQVLARRFGDCKDKASLLHALLEAAGIDSRLVLLRMRRLGRIAEAPASLAIFNHAILWVPELDLWLDGTAAWSGTRDLPGEDRGATVLVVNPDAPPRFGTIPEASPGDNRIDSRFEVALRPDGGARVKGRWRIAGAQAPSYRRAYLAESERRTQLEQAFNRTFPGVSVAEVSVSDLTRLEDDVDMTFALDVPRYAQPDGGGLRFTPFGSGRGYTDAWASLGARRHDLVLGDPSESRFSYRYALPEGWTVAELPEPAAADGPAAAFEVRYRVEDGALVADGHVTFKAARVAAAEYPAFRELVARLDRALARRVRIAPPPRAEASR